MSAKFVVASALAAAALAHPRVAARQGSAEGGAAAAAIPTVSLPLGLNLKVTTNLTMPWSNTSVELVFDSGSENFWVFGPGSITNWGCTGLLCKGPCNASVSPFYDWPSSPTASKPPQAFNSFYAYGAYTKYVTGSIAINDTFTFTADSGASTTVENVRVAVEDFMSQRLPKSSDGTCNAAPSGYDRGILGTAPFYRKSDWNTTGPHLRQDLLRRGAIKAPVQSMWFDEPPQEWNGSFSGHAVFGGIEKSKFAGPLVKLPVLENDALGASVGYFVAQPNVSVDGGATPLPKGKLITAVCHLDSGTTSDDLPVDEDAFMSALGLVRNSFGAIAWPGPCASIPLSKTFDLTFPALPGQEHESVNIRVPLRHYARPGSDANPNSCALRITTGGCMLSAPFSAAVYFAADDAANEIALAQGGVSERGKLPDPAAMSLTI